MAQIIEQQSIVYAPVFDPEHNNYKDESPFERREKGKVHICKCRHRDDAFSSFSTFKLHVKLVCHKNYVLEYGKVVNEEFTRVKEENDILKKEKVIQTISFDKLTAQKDREIDMLMNKLDRMTIRKDFYKNNKHNEID